MKLMNKSKIFISAIILAWFLQACHSGPEADEPELNSTIEKTLGGEKLYRKAPASQSVPAPMRSPANDLDGGISGTGHKNNLEVDQAN